MTTGTKIGLGIGALVLGYAIYHYGFKTKLDKATGSSIIPKPMHDAGQAASESTSSTVNNADGLVSRGAGSEVGGVSFRKRPRSTDTYTDSKGNVWIKSNRV